MSVAEEAGASEAALEPIPLTIVAEDAKAPTPVRWGFAVPKIVDYLVVAIFMYFTL